MEINNLMSVLSHFFLFTFEILLNFPIKVLIFHRFIFHSTLEFRCSREKSSDFPLINSDKLQLISWKRQL